MLDFDISNSHLLMFFFFILLAIIHAPGWWPTFSTISFSFIFRETKKNDFHFPMTLNLSFCCHIWKVHTQLSQLLNKAQCSESCKNWSVFFYTLHSLCLAQHHKCTKGCFKIFSSNLVFWAHMMNISFFHIFSFSGA